MLKNIYVMTNGQPSYLGRVTKRMADTLLPHNTDAEANFLGFCLMDPEIFVLYGGQLCTRDFYLVEHRWLFEAFGKAVKNGGIDYTTVSDHLDREGHLEEFGGLAALINIVNLVKFPTNPESWIDIIKDYSYRREALQGLQKGAKLVYNSVLKKAEIAAGLSNIILALNSEGSKSVIEGAELSLKLYDQFDEWLQNPLKAGETRGLACRLNALDKILGGLESGVYIVAARPSMGKTAMMLQMVEGICTQGKRCLFFTIEMSKEQVGERLATSLAKVSLQSLRQGIATPQQIQKVQAALGIIHDWPITIVDMSTLRSSDVLAECKKVQIQYGGIDAVFVDGLWLMTPVRTRENRTQTVGAISRDMKRVQRELNVPLVMAHQLNRSVERREDKRPMLSDLRDSGDVEQDTDVALMLYRSGYYQPYLENANVMEIWIRKNRLGGPSGECAKMYWQGQYTRLQPLSSS